MGLVIRGYAPALISKEQSSAPVGSRPTADLLKKGWDLFGGGALRKNLTAIPVFNWDLTPASPANISAKEADRLVALGTAISLKGKAIRLRKPGFDFSSRSPGDTVMTRYVEAKLSGRDPAAVNAVESWGPGKVKHFVETVRTVQI
jgi:hypothetical protein